MRKHSNEYIGIESLIGRKVLDAKINEEKDLVILNTDKGYLYLTWEGDCCAKCYIAHIEGSEALGGATIISADDSEWTIIQEGHELTIESMGTKIKTDKGYVTFESRVEHNGYYDGEILVSTECPLDQYHYHRYDEGYLPKLSPVRDF